MVTHRATYTLTRTDGKTEYISRPFKSKKEAKEDLYDELERLEKDGVLESLTYCNILEESQEPKEESNLFTLWGEPADEELRETYRKKLNKKLDKLYKKRMKLDDKIEAVREELEYEFSDEEDYETMEELYSEERQMSDIEIVVKLLQDNGFSVTAVKEEDTCTEFKTLKIEVIKDYSNTDTSWKTSPLN